MTDTELLRKKMDESGYKLRFIAAKVGLTYQGFLNKCNNKSAFRTDEVQTLFELLNMTEADRTAIFFAQSVGK